MANSVPFMLVTNTNSILKKKDLVVGERSEATNIKDWGLKIKPVVRSVLIFFSCERVNSAHWIQCAE